jgi:uncharacterized protein (DUF934 family)
MPLIRKKRVVADTWQHADDETSLPAAAGAIVSLARWQSERLALIGRNAPLGIRLTSEERAEDIADDLDCFDVIALEFPTFKDGRAYSTARLLRERYHFKGELRAVGQILRDQLAFLERCGFDAFEYAGDTPADIALNAFNEINVVYQSATDRRRPAGQLRNAPSAVFINGTCG